MSLTKDQKKATLEALFKDLKNFQATQDEISKLFGRCDGDFEDSAGRLIDNYVNTVAALLNDKGDWIAWYIWENDFGAREMEAGLDSESMKPICNIEDLLEIMNLGE